MPTPVIIRRQWDQNLHHFGRYSTINHASNRNPVAGDAIYIDVYESLDQYAQNWIIQYEPLK